MNAAKPGPVPPHYVRGNKLSRVPREFVYISVAPREKSPNVLTWRSGIAAASFIAKDSKHPAIETLTHYQYKSAMWAMITDLAIEHGKVIVCSHRLADDIRLSDAIPQLIGRGWVMDRLNVRDDAFSGAFHLGKAKITLLDLKSWLPITLAKLGQLAEVTLNEYLSPTRDGDTWMAEIFARLMATKTVANTLWEWVRANELGNWKPTGAGMAWANWRHAHYTDKVLMHGRVDLMEIERQAAGTGRAEAWKHGHFTDVVFDEWDLTLAYPNIALSEDLPIAYSGEIIGASTRLLTSPPKGKRFLIEAIVTQSQPVLGVNTPTGWLWPVGTVRGYWWDCEIKAAVEAGASVKVVTAYHYRAAPALTDWAGWIFWALAASDDIVPPAAKVAAKHWGRALIGRMGVRYSQWEKSGPAPKQGYFTTVTHDVDTGITTPTMVLGEDMFLAGEKVWGHDALPQVMSAIMAKCRVQLWELMNVAGLDHVVYIDTDSLIVDEHGSQALGAWATTNPTAGLRVKYTYNEVDIYGPRQLIHPRRSKISGVPLTAKHVGGVEFDGEVMDGIAGSFFKGTLDTISIDARSWKLGTKDTRRSHGPDSSTLAYTATPTEAGHRIA